MIKVTNSIVCDDVRQETSGKVILIGVYGSDMILRQAAAPSATVRLFLWVEFEASEDARIDLRGVVEFAPDLPSETVAYAVTTHLLNAPELTQQTWGSFPCRVDFPHALRFEYRVGDGEWQFMRRLHIKHMTGGATTEV